MDSKCNKFTKGNVCVTYCNEHSQGRSESRQKKVIKCPGKNKKIKNMAAAAILLKNGDRTSSMFCMQWKGIQFDI